jgi:hypothetical protein
MAPEPFKISIPQEKVDSLKKKLSLAEFPDELSASEWDLGVPLADMKRLTKAWENWDWRQAEERLNKVPQYHTGIKVDGFDELDIHFFWQKSEAKNAIPLLFVHGCRFPAQLWTSFADKFQGLGHSSKSSPFSHSSPNRKVPHSILLFHPSPITVQRRPQDQRVCCSTICRNLPQADVVLGIQ